MKKFITLFLGISLLTHSGSLYAKKEAWSFYSSSNLLVGDGPGDQILPKIAPTDDGGYYVSWIDNGTGGYDVRLQKLDALGYEEFEHNGILVADRKFGWVMDYGLDVDSAGNALLTFRDDRLTGIQITASKVSPTGALLWGELGIQLTNTTSFIASPKIAGTSDGGVVVAWTQESEVWLQKLSPNGDPFWGTGIVLSPPGSSFLVSDLHDTGTSVIVSIVHETGEFGSPRHLLAQKLDAAGIQEWGVGCVSVFDGGTLQFGNFPTFIPDGKGGAIFSWYITSNLQLQCYAQHILSDGNEAFPHNGSAVSTNTTRVRVSPSATFDAISGETFLFWIEKNSDQSKFGVYSQKLNSSGERQWSDEGVVVVPVCQDVVSLVRSLRLEGGTFVFWSLSPSFGEDQLFGAWIDDFGNVNFGPFDVASTPSVKSHLDVELSANNFAILAWSDEQNGEADILAQKVNLNGSLGNPRISIGLSMGRPAVWLALQHPNPSNGFIFIVFIFSELLSVFAIFNLHGQVVRTLHFVVPSAAGTLVCDGSDECQPAGRGGGVVFRAMSR
ncbi:MAG: hypothetical protein JXB26_06290 [Candidatus Aminicenantes bacterium]|nr:hypothetical protein [Candidatus Aminicenantes bacterium]